MKGKSSVDTAEDKQPESTQPDTTVNRYSFDRRYETEEEESHRTDWRNRTREK